MRKSEKDQPPFGCLFSLFFNKHPGKSHDKFQKQFFFSNQSKHDNWLVPQRIRSRVRFIKKKSWILIKIWNRIDQRFSQQISQIAFRDSNFMDFHFTSCVLYWQFFKQNFEFDFSVDFQNRWIANLKISIKIFYVEIIGWKVHDFFKLFLKIPHIMRKDTVLILGRVF